MKQKLKSWFIIAVGNILLTAAYAFLTVPNNMINGGVTSTSLLLSHFLKIDIGYISGTMTLFLLAFGFFAHGKDFFWNSFFSSICYIVFFNTFHMISYCPDFPMILCALIAGILVGIGHFLCLYEDYSTVGYDVIALYVHKKIPKWNTVIILRFIGMFVLVIGIMTFGILSVLYGLFFTFVQTQVIYLLGKKYKKTL